MDLVLPSEKDWFLRFTRGVAGAATRWHDGKLEGARSLPGGPVLLVGNHGLYGFESPVFFYLLHRATGRFPVGLADRVVFGKGPLAALISRVGGVVGTRENAEKLLRDGQLVVCYPGGAHEVFKDPVDRYRLQWGHTSGFARLAIATGVPVVPFAALGVDDSYVNFGHARLARKALGRYAVPFGVGLGPLPLPFQFRFRLGAPLTPPSDEAHAPTFKEEVRTAVEELLRFVPATHADAAPTPIPAV